MRNRNFGLSIIALSLVIVAIVAFANRAGVNARQDKAKALPSASKQLTSPSPNGNDVGLARNIDRIIEDSNLKRGRWGIFVTALKDDRVLYSRNGDQLFIPASNMKLYTTAAALDLLGADYRWRTSVYTVKQPDTSGVIDGDLILYGRGAPDLVSRTKGDAPSLEKFADQLYEAGVRHVRGNVVGDESYFRSELFGVGWQWNDLQWYYGAQPSALSIDENTVEVTMSPAAKTGDHANVVITPNQNYMRLTNNAATVEREAVTSIGIMRDLSGNDVRVWGEFPAGGRAFSAFLSVHNPSLWAATTLRQALTERGIKVDGEARSRDYRVAEVKFDPQKSFEIAYQMSEPLSEIVRKTNKESNNLYAELLLRTIGKERGSTAPDPDSRKNATRGDDEAGTAVIRSWMESKGVATAALAIRDGSGLSRLDLVTPEGTARLLVAMTRTNSAHMFHDSLPSAGKDGTLQGRLKKFEGRIFAKTGSLTYVHSLSGYAIAATGDIVAFSIFCNDVTADRAAIRIIDEIAAAIADFPSATAK